MALTLILVAIIVLLIILEIIMVEWPSLRTIYMASKIHGRWGFPIVGLVYEIWKLSGPSIMDYLKQILDQYPRLTSFYAGGIYAIYVQEPEDLQVILSSVNHIRKGREYNPVKSWLNEGLLTSDGSKWHTNRKLLTPAFHFRILENSLAVINSNSSLLLEKLAETNGRPVKVEEYVSRCALDIIGETAMGIKLEAQSEAGKDYLNSVRRTSEGIIERILTVWQIKDWIFKLTPKSKYFYKNVKILHDFTDNVIKRRKEIYEQKHFSIDEDSGKKTRKAFLDCLIEAQKEQGTLTDLDIRAEVDTFMFEGHDTTSAAITFALWLLGTFPEEQEKVYSELKEMYADEDAEISSADTHSMVYLDKVIKETLRLYPSVPYISRNLMQDCVLEDGTVLPTTANVIMLPYFIHRNPRFYPEPEKFDPERFSDENSQGRHPFAYIPFSAGPRNCIGQKFAMLEMKVTLAKILRKFKVTAVTRRDEFKIMPYLVIRPTIPLVCKFNSRAKAS